MKVLIRLTLGLVIFISGHATLPSCGGQPAGAPLIRLFSFTGQEANRRNIFLFKIEWEDAEGDLASESVPAKVVFKVQDLDNPNQAPIEFSFQFGQSLIKKGTLKGTIPNDKIAPIQLSAEIRPDPSQPYPKRIKVTATLIDSNGNSSNQPSVTLQSQGN